MSVPYSGTLRRSAGVISAISKQLRNVNLKAAKRITVTFDPFGENVTHTRNFLHYISSPKISSTNPNCALKSEVVCDRREPTIDIIVAPNIAETANIKKITFKSGNLTCLELLQLLNKHISSLAPVEEPVATIQTKSEKKKSKKK
ncbi:large ribosomal subunit protein mL53 [Plodia interpunctella]|uniref:large ribosomal subunit protein mL53 n=1 Tax=Plodia interpunctella TaxID=58824 RepID=UPI002367B3BC|nr:39S ribosomal protein L53, mitochondrial [Plodia interpunctella]